MEHFGEAGPFSGDGAVDTLDLPARRSAARLPTPSRPGGLDDHVVDTSLAADTDA